MSGVKSVEKYYDKLAEDYEAAVRAWGYCLPEACIDSLVKYAQFDANDTNVTVLDLGCGSGTLISLINVEVGINVEGMQKLPNH